MEPKSNSSIENLTQYISDAKEILAIFETAVGWNSPNVAEIEAAAVPSVVCPHDGNHIMPKFNLSRHVRSCKWKQVGYSSAEARDIVEGEDSVREDRNISISTDAIISKVAPHAPQIRTDDRYKCLLSPDQRLAVYEEEVRQCYSGDKPMPDKALYADLEAQAAEKLYQKENPENLSEVELLQKMRDMKKKRQSYRAKNVHITKRSQTEIIRGVLDVHMEELSRLWNTKSNNDRNSDKSDAVKYERHKTAHSDRHEIDRKMSTSRSVHRKHSSDRRHSSSKFGIQYHSEFGSRSRSSQRNGDDKAHSSSSRSRREKDVSFDKNSDKHSKSNEGRSGCSKRHSAQKESSHKSKRSKHSHK